MSCKFGIALTLLSVSAMSAMSMKLPEDIDSNWEDFDNAIKEEDCFGSECEGKSSALFMIQANAKASLQLKNHKIAMPSLQDQIDISMEDLSDAIAFEDGGATAALALVQTSASAERASTVSNDAHVGIAVDAEGHLEVNPEDHQSANGAMTMSVDSHGHFHWEAVASSMSLLQAEHRVSEKVRVYSNQDSEETSSDTNEAPIGDDVVTPSEFNDFEESEGVSMMQTELHKSNEAMTIVANADGTLATSVHEKVMPSDGHGMMHISVDEYGHIDSEEGFMFMQTKTELNSAEEATEEKLQSENEEAKEEWDASLIGSTVEGHPSWTLEAMTDFAATSLLQTEMHTQTSSSEHQYAVAGVDGTIENHPQFAKLPSDGMMHMSVDSTGVFHMEI